jgi:hypothetical protein
MGRQIENFFNAWRSGIETRDSSLTELLNGAVRFANGPFVRNPVFWGQRGGIKKKNKYKYFFFFLLKNKNIMKTLYFTFIISINKNCYKRTRQQS